MYGIASGAGSALWLKVSIAFGLAWLVLESAGASVGERLLFVFILAALFAASFASLVRRPEAVAIGYKG